MRQSYHVQRRYDDAFSKFELLQKALGDAAAREKTFAALRICAEDSRSVQSHHQTAINEIATLIRAELEGMAGAALGAARAEVLEAGEALTRALKADALDIKNEERKEP